MKVVFDHQIFSNQQYGGISRYFVELAKNIPKVSLGSVETRVIAPLYKNQYLKQSADQVAIQGISVPHIPRTGWLIRSANSFFSASAYYYYAPDIIHETYYSSNEVSSSKAKRIITVYDMIHELFHEHFSHKDRTVEIKKHAVARSDHVICISENTRNDLVNILKIDPVKTSVVHLGFSLLSDEQPIMIDAHMPFILYVGPRSGYKNFAMMIKAYARSPQLIDNIKVLAFGGGRFTADELSLFDRLKLPKDSVSHVSGSDALLALYYRNASLFVYPSLYEGFGIPPLEAMSYGCPVACSDTSSIPEVVGDAAIFFDPYSSESISTAIEKVLFDSMYRKSLVLKGFARIRGFSWAKCARETCRVYQQVLQ